MRKITLLLALFLTGSISTMAQGGLAAQQKHDIEPMLTTVWAQNDPYWFYTPTYFNSDQCVTGCVSVAAAQVMKYYKWPHQGVGSSSYNWSNGVMTSILSANYEHEYKWDLMKDDIDTIMMTPAQRAEAGVTMYNVDAIARLMSDLGIAFEMQYMPRPSSAYLSHVPAALVEHFGYDRTARFAYREYYTDEQWEDLIYTELAEGRPVIYAGSSSTGSHSFVIDGYAQGKFHCNWGWGGVANGYYSLKNLTPTYDTGGEDTPGIEGYNKNHFAVIGIRPFAGSDWTYSMGITKDFQVCETDAEGYLVPVTKINRETTGKYWYLYGGAGTSTDVGFKNISPVDMVTEFGIEFTNTKNSNVFVLVSPVGAQPLPANSGFPYVAFSYTDIMQTGTFDLRPVFRPYGTDNWIPVMQTPNAKKVQLTVEGNTPPIYLTKPLTIGNNNICYSNTITVKASIYSSEDIDNVWINPIVYSLEGITPTPVMETINGQQYYLGQQRDFFKLVNLKQGVNEVELSVDYPEADPDKQYIIYCQYYKDANFNGVFEPQSNAMVFFKITNEAISAPTTVNAQLNNKSIIVSWSAVQGATSYQVYRSGDNSKYTMLASGIQVTSYKDSSPLKGTNYYKVKAINQNGESVFSIASPPVTFDESNDVEAGLYMGIIGFNKDLTDMGAMNLLTPNTKNKFLSFVNSLTTENGTLLYYAVDQALNKLTTTPLPSNLSDVAIITFTDGLDQGSLSIVDYQYSTRDEYRTILANRIQSTRVQGLPLSAYSIGLRGGDVTNYEEFKKDLSSLASSENNAEEVNNMNEVNSRFHEIADQLIKITETQIMSIKFPKLDEVQTFRFTFDNVTDAAMSKHYIEGTMNARENTMNNVKYVGLSCSSGTFIQGTASGNADVVFDFENVQMLDGSNVSLDNINEFYWEGNYWQVNSEFDKDKNLQVNVTRSSAAIMLVLDCSSSLQSNGDKFTEMKNHVKTFIETLSSAMENELKVKDITNAVPSFAPTSIYNISGERIPTLTRGLNIVRDNSGYRKVFILR